MVFVPGGWASNKLDTLGEGGSEAIRRFVSAGGHYLGICGGAGLATQDGLGLLPISRKPSSERIPSFSGRIRLDCAGHPIWEGPVSPLFHAWWPSQLKITGPDLQVLARFAKPQADAFSSDISVDAGEAAGWAGLEERYGILLDPARLNGEPAVVEGRFGRGRVILSLVHFDTPGDSNGARVLKNLWAYLDSPGGGPPEAAGREQATLVPKLPREALEAVGQMQAAVGGLITSGIRDGLWRWRTPWLLQWRRGVRGLEYTTLAVMIDQIAGRIGTERPAGSVCPGTGTDDSLRLADEIDEIRRRLIPFCEEAGRLLAEERSCLAKGLLSPTACGDEGIERRRAELFGRAMSHGGRFKELIDRVDRLLYGLIREG
jgi:putative intracellular protease/amidase